MVNKVTIQINVARDFSKYPGGRYNSDGPYNGERFREEFLVPVLKRGEKAQIILDGTRGYGSSFLEEAFGGLVRENFTYEQIMRAFDFFSDNPILLAEINKYMISAH